MAKCFTTKVDGCESRDNGHTASCEISLFFSFEVSQLLTVLPAERVSHLFLYFPRRALLRVGISLVSLPPFD